MSAGARGRDWSLDREGLGLLLGRLDPDRERAGEAYEKLRQRLIAYFAFNGRVAAEDLADESIDRLCAKLRDGVPVERCAAYALRIASLLLLEAGRRGQREHRAHAMLALVGEGHARSAANEARARCAELCLSRLGRGERDLLLGYYSQDGRARIDGRRLLAERLGIPTAALRLRVLRLRAKLEACLRSHLAPSSGAGAPRG